MGPAADRRDGHPAAGRRHQLAGRTAVSAVTASATAAAAAGVHVPSLLQEGALHRRLSSSEYILRYFRNNLLFTQSVW